MKVLTLFIFAFSIYVSDGLNLYDKGCNSDADCPGVAKCLAAGCLGTQCLCPETYMPNDEYTKCLKVIDLEEKCNLDTRCRLPNTRCSNGKCECEAGFIPAVDNIRCKKKALAISGGWALLNESCSSSILCTDGHTMKCDGVCKCTTNYREATAADLSAFPNNGECVSSSYTLGEDISLYRKHCLAVPEGGVKDIGEECTTDNNCPGNATCQQVGCEQKCSCEAGFAPSDDRKNCLKLIPLEKACDADSVCETLHSRCSDEEKGGTCICDYGYEVTGAALCRKVSNFPGSVKYATINESCVTGSVKINCQADLECTNGICQCDSSIFREASVLERIAFNPEGYCVPIVATLNPTDAKKNDICAEVSVVSSQTTQSTANITTIMATDVPMPTESQVPMLESSASQLDIMATESQVPMPESSASQLDIMATESQVPMPESSASQLDIMATESQMPMQESSASQLDIMATESQVPMQESSASQLGIMATESQVPMQESSASQLGIMATESQVPMQESSASQLGIMATESQVPMQESSASQLDIMATESQVPMQESSASQLDIMATESQVPMQESSASQLDIMATESQVPMQESSASQLDIMATESQVPMHGSSTSQLEIMATESSKDVSYVESLYSSQEGIHTVPLSSSPTVSLSLTLGSFTDTSIQPSPDMQLVDSTAISIDKTSSDEVSASIYITDTNETTTARTSTVEVVTSIFTNDTETNETTEATTTAIAKVGVYDSCVDETVCPVNAECQRSSCSGNKCFCKAGYFPANKDTECLRGAKLNEDCNDTITCSVPFSVCKVGKCACSPVFARSTTDGFCAGDLPSVGESCTGNDKCHGMAHCNSTTSLCQCDEGFREADEAEVFSAGPVWFVNGRCIRLVVNEVAKECAKVEVGDVCSSDFNCPDNSSCISAVATGTDNCNKRCWCDVGFAPSADRKSCLPVINIGETCDRAKNRCITPLSKCINNKCECFRGFLPAVNNTFCKPQDYKEYGITTPILGQTCDNGYNRCVMKGEQFCGSSDKCECVDGLRPATYLDQLALYYDMRQCRNASVPEGYRPPISCADPPLPQIGSPDLDLPDNTVSDVKRNQLLMYILVPVAVIAAAVLAIIYTVARRRRVLARKNDDTSSVDSETNSLSSFHLPRPQFNLSRFRSDQTWTEPQTKYNTPSS